MTPTELINHSRLCPLDEVRRKLEKLQRANPEHYEIVENFILSCKTDDKFQPKEPALDP